MISPEDGMIGPEKAIEFLDEAARYFESRDTGGEDKAHWANVYNAQNCRKIANLIWYMKQTP